jgi:hypothetical protein
MEAAMWCVDPDIEHSPPGQIGKAFEGRVPGSNLATGCDFGKDIVVMGG